MGRGFHATYSKTKSPAAFDTYWTQARHGDFVEPMLKYWDAKEVRDWLMPNNARHLVVALNFLIGPAERFGATEFLGSWLFQTSFALAADWKISLRSHLRGH